MSQPGSAWRGRYAARATTLREQRAWRAVQAGGIDWDPVGAYGPGLDGAEYRPGWVEEGQSLLPPGAMLLIRTRAMTELIAGWGSYAEMRDWLAGRGTTGSGRLIVPPAARRARCVAEETVLAHMLGRMEDAGPIGRYLPAQTWTSDVRYDLAMAILAVAEARRRCSPAAERVADALAGRAGTVPASRLRLYGGRGMRIALVYLARLDETPVPAEAARAAVTGLRLEDAQAASARARRRAVPGPRRAAADAARPQRAIAAPGLRLPAPRP